MGLDMLRIPAMSSDCERVFSQAKLMITGQRHRLKPDIVEASQCLRAWLIIDRKKLGK
jgi:hAT family C-terminal dimerisation region